MSKTLSAISQDLPPSFGDYFVNLCVCVTGPLSQPSRKLSLGCLFVDRPDLSDRDCWGLERKKEAKACHPLTIITPAVAKLTGLFPVVSRQLSWAARPCELSRVGLESQVGDLLADYGSRYALRLMGNKNDK